MSALKAKKLLFNLAKASEQQLIRIPRREILVKINEIKNMAKNKKVPQAVLQRKIINLEKHLQDVLSLEKEFKIKEKRHSHQLSTFKSQLKDLRKKLAAAKSPELRARLNKLHHLVGDTMAKHEVKKEVADHKTLAKIPLRLPVPPEEKIRILEEKLTKIKESGKYSTEEMHHFEERINNLKEKISPPLLEVKHKMTFGPQVAVHVDESLPELEIGIEHLPMPPPPKIKK
ncbi:hypothetical protein HOC13_00870 [Candidatus Woesearchaeota archaeon]|jgi:hypothetical protein|nr:hypothetical protein [Candidatus Woesearchaeota archaeon]